MPERAVDEEHGYLGRVVGLEEVHAGTDLPDELDRLPQAAARVLVGEARIVHARHHADEAEVGLGALGKAFTIGEREGEGDRFPAGVLDLDVEVVPRRSAEHPHRLAGVQQCRGVHPGLVGEVAVDVHERGEPIGPGWHDEVVRPGSGHDEVVDQPLAADLTRVDENHDRQVARVRGAHRALQHGVLARLLQVAPQAVEHAPRQQQEGDPARPPAQTVEGHYTHDLTEFSHDHCPYTSVGEQNRRRPPGRRWIGVNVGPSRVDESATAEACRPGQGGPTHQRGEGGPGARGAGPGVDRSAARSASSAARRYGHGPTPRCRPAPFPGQAAPASSSVLG